LEYATRLLGVPAVLFDGAIAPLLLARWSEEIAAHGREPPRAEVVRIVAKGLALALGCALALVASAPLVVHLLLAHGRFTSSSEVAVVRLLQLLAVGFVATMGALMLERFYLASTRNRTLAVLSLCRAGIRVVSVWFLLPSYGLTAFAIGYALADWSYLITLVGLLRPAIAAAGVVSARAP
jgi:peptidoglycan biosynthesis protein MviN/MurJ (putative lipid II flippase)